MTLNAQPVARYEKYLYIIKNTKNILCVARLTINQWNVSIYRHQPLGLMVMAFILLVDKAKKPPAKKRGAYLFKLYLL